MTSPADFHHLTPDVVLETAEAFLGGRFSNLCRPLNSYINRVYELRREDGEFVIAKFYRPNRWSVAALQEEHDFLLELQAGEIPVVAPLAGREGRTLESAGGLHSAFFPKRGGRVVDEPDEAQWRELGRLLARVHQVGAQRPAAARVTLAPGAVTRAQVDFILTSGLVPSECRAAYAAAVQAVIARMEPLFADVEFLRIHGDCHRQNLIYRPGESFYIIDFDDMATGPTVQDLWMMLPGRVTDARRELDALLEGYELFREFNFAELKLVEPLRAMRFIHFTAWCARQAADGGFQRLAPDWGAPAYWRRETDELNKQRVEIEDALNT